MYVLGVSLPSHESEQSCIYVLGVSARRRPAPRSAPFSSPWTQQQRVVMPPIKPWPGKRPAKSPQNRHHLMIHSEAGGRRRVNFSSHPRALTKALADASDQRQVSGLGLGCLSPLSTIFQLHPGSLISGGNPEYPEKTTDLPQLTDNLKFYRQQINTKMYVKRIILFFINNYWLLFGSG